MSNIIEINGDALSFQNWNAVGHCANCQNVMGSGIAASIKKLFPQVWGADCFAKQCNKNVLGNISYAEIPKGKFIFNLYGQEFFGTGRQVNYESIYQALEKMRQTITQLQIEGNVAFPYKMASDRAGGDWDIILAMIKSVFAKATYFVFIAKL